MQLVLAFVLMKFKMAKYIACLLNILSKEKSPKDLSDALKDQKDVTVFHQSGSVSL